jgi:hypothetical protein
MMKQMTFADAQYAGKRKQTRKQTKGIGLFLKKALLGKTFSLCSGS